MIYVYHLECKKECDIDYIIETDDKDIVKKMKPTCPVCKRRLYPNEERTEVLGGKVVKKNTPKKDMKKEIEKRNAHKKATDGRRKRKSKVA